MSGKSTKISSKSDSAKFSILETDELYKELERFISWLASINQNPDVVLMEYDELVGELMMEFVKGIEHYKDSDMTRGQMKAILRRMMDNRISELRHRHYSTHRQAAINTIPLFASEDYEIDDWKNYLSSNAESYYLDPDVNLVSPDPSSLSESHQRVVETRELLSDQAKKVFDAMIFGNERLTKFVKLSMTRRSTHYRNVKATIKTWHIAEALMMEERTVRNAVREIKRTYAEVVANG